MCLYRWATPNPVKNRAQKHPLLGRRSPRSLYCSPCTSNVHCNWSSETCASLQEQLTKGEVSQSDYDETRKKYLAGVNGDGPRCRPENGGAVSRQKVQTEKTKSLKFRRNCGVLWEVAQWDAAVLDPHSPAYKQPVAVKAEIMVVSVEDNLKVTGVLRDKSFGEPIGTWTVSEDVMKTMRLLSDVADTKDNPDGPEAAWAVASKRKLATLDSVEVGTQDEPRSSKTLKVFTPSKSQGSKRDDMDFSALDDLFLDSSKKSGAAARRAVVSRQELAGIAKGCTTARQWH